MNILQVNKYYLLVKKGVRTSYVYIFSLNKAIEKQIKTIEGQEEKQIKALEEHGNN